MKFGKTLDRSTSQEVEMTRARMKTVRVCVFHIGHNSIKQSTALVGEVLTVMLWEFMCYQVDFLSGDGNTACYTTHPSSSSSEVQMPTYTNSLLQFLLRRMVNTATQYRKKHYDKEAAPIRVKNIIAAPYQDLKKMQEKLENINRATYTNDLAKETEECGDCCSLHIIEWGHSLSNLYEDVKKFKDEDHMNAVGEFFISVNETVCWPITMSST